MGFQELGLDDLVLANQCHDFRCQSAALVFAVGLEWLIDRVNPWRTPCLTFSRVDVMAYPGKIRDNGPVLVAPTL